MLCLERPIGASTRAIYVIIPYIRASTSASITCSGKQEGAKKRCNIVAKGACFVQAHERSVSKMGAKVTSFCPHNAWTRASNAHHSCYRQHAAITPARITWYARTHHARDSRTLARTHACTYHSLTLRLHARMPPVRSTTSKCTEHA
eukprot:6204098-Pleurochrysis_carterae.AAC.3